MMLGHVTAALEAIIRLTVRGPRRQEVILDATIDTGFTEYLCLPPAVVAALGLPFQNVMPMTLADGSTVLLGLYEATVIWDGQARTIPVLEADGGALVGMALLRGHELYMHVVDGGHVTIQAVP